MTPSPQQLAEELCKELYDRYVMGGWEPPEGTEYAVAALEKYSNARAAEMREMAAKVANEKREMWSNANGFGGHTAAAHIIEDLIRALPLEESK